LTEFLDCGLSCWREGRGGIDKDSLFGGLCKSDSGTSTTDRDGGESVLVLASLGRDEMKKYETNEWDTESEHSGDDLSDH
jgi:hypothetical protein